MFYIDLSLQFLIKLVGQFIPYIIILFVFLMVVTAVTKDKSWAKKSIDKIIN